MALHGRRLSSTMPFEANIPTVGIKDKSRCDFDSCNGFSYLGWLMGLEPTTTGITILGSTN